MFNGVCNKEIFKNHRFHRVEIIIEEGKEAGRTKNKGKRREKEGRKKKESARKTLFICKNLAKNLNLCEKKAKILEFHTPYSRISHT